MYINTRIHMRILRTPGFLKINESKPSGWYITKEREIELEKWAIRDRLRKVV